MAGEVVVGSRRQGLQPGDPGRSLCPRPAWRTPAEVVRIYSRRSKAQREVLFFFLKFTKLVRGRARVQTFIRELVGMTIVLLCNPGAP